jgi:hypothetical protein
MEQQSKNQVQPKEIYQIPQITDLGMIKDKFEESFEVET